MVADSQDLVWKRLGKRTIEGSTVRVGIGSAGMRAVEGRVVASSNLAPEHQSLMQDRLVAQLGRGNTLRRVQCRFESDRAYHCARSPIGRGNRLKSGRVLVRIQPGAPYAPVADGEASGFQTRDWVFESPLGCHAPQQQVASGRVATSACAVRFRGGAPSFSNAEEWTSC